MLTDRAVKAARARSAGYKLADVGGLHLFVAPNGRRSFRLRFRWQGKEQLLTFGTWPEVSLEEARRRATQARDQLGRGEDPRVCELAETDEVRAFEYEARRWYQHMLPRWTPDHAREVLASLERDVFPAIGAMPLAAITAPVVLNALRSIEERGRAETARRVRQRISAVFVFAMSEGLVDSDPAAIVGRALMPPAPQRRHPALLDITDARELLAAVDQLEAAPAAKLASRFLALTAVRLAAVRGALWSEIEDLDGPAPLWRVPAARMKLAAAKKLDAGNDHLVPLSAAAVAVLREVRAMQICIPSMHIFTSSVEAEPISETAIGALYVRAGYAGRHVPHGWRASFSTILNETGLFDRALIERALAHAPKDKVAAAYDRSSQIYALRVLFEAWGGHLTGN